MTFSGKVYINKFPSGFMFYSEKKAEDFLEKNRFNIVKRGYAKDGKELEKAFESISFPAVMKVSGGKIVHKNQIGGVITNIQNFSEVLGTFNRLKRISGFEGVIIQEQVSGKEVLIGVKKTPDFGHAVCVGSGGVDTEKLKDVSFRIYPFDKKEAKKMLSETRISRELNKDEKEAVVLNLLEICRLIKQYLNISELDINPLMVDGKKAVVVDVRIVFI